MLASKESAGAATYLNPVYSRSFPDPFVLKFGGEYYAYSTGYADDGNVFGVIRSSDLVRWTALGGAMLPLEDSPPYYWAPEAIYSNGRFYLYYSVGNEVLMELRVAVSDRPDGGFVDSGQRLTSEDFAIDAHVFTESNGERYLFYAADFLDHTHIGTGTVVDRMIDLFTLEGNPKPVTRAKYDWQVYDPARKEKGGVRWHTVEGPTVLRRKGLYYEMFSGGNWQNTSYGVSFAVSDRIIVDKEWPQFSDGENVLPILRTLPGSVVGPGHNSVIRGPNNRELYCVYHRWVGDDRVMAIDRMDFAGDRIFVVGPSFTEQPAPFHPRISERFLSGDLSPNFTAVGEWIGGREGLVSVPHGRSELALATAFDSFLCEVEVETVGSGGGRWGLSIRTLSDGVVRLEFNGDSAATEIDGRRNEVSLPADFDFTAKHLFRIEVDSRMLSINIDDTVAFSKVMLNSPVGAMAIFSDDRSVRVCLFELTEGFEELFEIDHRLEDNGWTVDGSDNYSIRDGEISVKPDAAFTATKGPTYTDVEYAVNFRATHETRRGVFGITLATGGEGSLRFAVEPGRQHLTVNDTPLPLPRDVALTQYHQLRLIKRNGTAIAYFDDVRVGEFSVHPGRMTCGIFSEQVGVAIEMIRITAI